GDTAAVTITATGLDEASRTKLLGLCRRMGCHMAPDFGAAVTHVVVNAHFRDATNAGPAAVKYLMGVACGRWLVSAVWVEDSLKAGALLAEEPYELRGDRKSLRPDGPRRSRLAWAAGQPPLFRGTRCTLVGRFDEGRRPSRESLTALLRAAGAELSDSLEAL
ncbi:unnamed protein product, partial [Phaeothamnion confervicola]